MIPAALCFAVLGALACILTKEGLKASALAGMNFNILQRDRRAARLMARAFILHGVATAAAAMAGFILGRA
jgi:predicted histidine transporter YuiF (NhaC family)